jgi:hypothetical protein
MSRRNSTTKGFRQTGALLSTDLRRVGESRGFAVSRVLTHWAEIAGEDLARLCRPVEVSYPRGSFGATLTVLTTGAQAPMLEMQKEMLRDRVNAAYGYNAIARIRITQTAPTGFAEGQAVFGPAPAPQAPQADPVAARRATQTATGIRDDGLRQALERLGLNVLSNRKH